MTEMFHNANGTVSVAGGDAGRVALILTSAALLFPSGSCSRSGRGVQPDRAKPRPRVLDNQPVRPMGVQL